jgi:transglutaminase-like putative cysteine protease
MISCEGLSGERASSLAMDLFANGERLSILEVWHKTTYRYRHEVTLGPHRLMLRPRASHDLRLVTTELTCRPSATIGWTYDVFGNSIATANFSKPASELTIESRIKVELFASAWPVFQIASSAISYPFSYDPDDRTDLGAMLAPQYPDPEGRLLAWARAFVRNPGTDTLSLLKDMNEGVLGWISYQSRDDDGTQSPLQSLQRGFGSCRDIARLMIEAARHLGFGARIVSGYLYTPSEQKNWSGTGGSTHAWVEIFLPGAGWISFDPTNRKVGGANLIPVAVARDIKQAVPVSGNFVGATDDFLGMTVAASVSDSAGILAPAPNGSL